LKTNVALHRIERVEAELYEFSLEKMSNAPIRAVTNRFDE